MTICGSCGEENPARFRLCGYCGAALHASPPPAEVRKTVTVVFCDLVGSTDLGGRLDSEALRELMNRYFGALSEVIEAHGGTIEKFIGDAVMAVFGLPVLHEDDALRAVRAAAAMGRALERLNDELDVQFGVRLANRTGVNTGEVVAGDPAGGQRLVTGDAVNVAARLEQAAGHGEVLIGALTERLVRRHVVTEPLAPLTLKGKPDPVPAFRLVEVADHGRAVAPDTPLVGRDAELASILTAFDDAVATATPRLVTVLGEPGYGKSRLTAEVRDRLAGRALVLGGRCLPYGRGITFWPLAELVHAAAGISETDSSSVALERLGALAGDEAIRRRVASAIGLTTETFAVEELFWGARELLERLAAGRPLLVVVEDLHWAELTFLDLLSHVAESGAAPILLLCTARRDVLELRPGWGQAPGQHQLALEPLGADAVGALLDAQLGGAVPPGLRRRIVEAADGNALFAEQLASMLIEDGRLERRDGGWVATGDIGRLEVPPTIQALLAARIDQLAPSERDVIAPAAVVGLEFEVAAVQALTTARAEPVEPDLASLQRKQLVSRRDEAAYAFRHMLLRDTAYGRLLKRMRADLHERFVTWAEQAYTARDSGDELGAVLGYHLEQAHRYLRELGPLDDHGRGLAMAAARRLTAAGRSAFAREDMPAAANLLRRAVALLERDDPERLGLLIPLGEAFSDIGDFPVAAMFLEEAAGIAEAVNDPVAHAQAALALLLVEGQSGDGTDLGERIVAAATTAVARLEAAGDDAGLASAWRAQAWAHGTAGRFGRTAAAAERAVHHATRAGDDRQRRRASVQYAVAALYGPTPVPEAIARCELILADAHGDRRTEGLLASLLSRLVAMRGDFDRARELYRRAQHILAETGRTIVAASTSLDSCGVEMLAGDPAAAERELRRDHALLSAMDEHYLLSTVAGELARVLVARGRTADARHFSRQAEELAAEDDVASQVLWRLGRARLLSLSGTRIAARQLAEEAVERLRGTDARVTQAEALMDLAEVLRAAGEHTRAERAALEALELCEAKGNTVAAAAARRWLDALAAAAAQRM